MKKVDFVVTWVNNADKKWLKKKNQYAKSIDKEDQLTTQRSYRDWGTFKYWFRGVEKFAPWVNKIYLVVDNQVPNWLKMNDKLVIVNHPDYMPEKFLPVFNSNAIESYLYKIPGLANHFVYFNDDMFLVKSTKKSDFFVNGLPCDIGVLSSISPYLGGTANFQVNNMELINKYFTKEQILKNKKCLHWCYGIDNVRTLLQLPTKFMNGFFEPHMPEAFLKSTFEELWKKENRILTRTASSKFRSKYDTNIWLFRDWQLAKGTFYPKNIRKFGHYYSTADISKVKKDMLSHKYHIMCINDDINLQEYGRVKKELLASFEEILPEKSSFEK